MRTLRLASLLLVSLAAAFAQDKSEIVDKAPPPIEDALRARVIHFYQLFTDGKFKEAYSMVADDSQDKFFQLGKDQYKGCEIIKINYTENFTKATVVTSCKSDWRFQGTTALISFPLVSNWEVLDGQWFWHYVKPTILPSPFSPSGYIPGPKDSADDDASRVPKDMNAAGSAILAKVGVDKSLVHLQPSGTSFDTVHVRNDLPGDVSVKLEMAPIPGLKVTMGQSVLHAHDTTAVVFEWNPADPAIQCLECVKRTISGTLVQLRIEPFSRVFPVRMTFQSPVPIAKPARSIAPAPKP